MINERMKRCPSQYLELLKFNNLIPQTDRTIIRIWSLKSCLVIVLFCLSTASHLQGQSVDIVIDMGIYKSYYSFELKEPLYVTYYLSKGGGQCDRDNEGFTFKKCGINSASDEDYLHQGYDKGHLANAEDFAKDCNLEAKTFCYFNCVPQTVRLNRGIWKVWEGKVRDLSQSKRLFVIAGAIYGKVTIGPEKIGVPDYCYKIVLEPKSHEILFCLLFPNDKSDSVQEVSLVKLKSLMNYPLLP